jgi:dihydroneopterin aldolase
MMDIVYIKNLRIETTIGIYDWEREIKQILVLNVEMGHDNRPAGESDNIGDTLDYFAISRRLIEFVEGSKMFLIERVAECCAQILLQEFSVKWVRLAVGKPGAVPEAEDVGVVIERGVRD